MVFFDGACGLCQRSVAWLVAHDSRRALRFAHLQGGFARDRLPAGLRDFGTDGAVVLLEPAAGDRISTRSAAVFRALTYLAAPWNWIGHAARIPLARPLFDIAYRFVARRRDAWFGRTDSCMLPDASWRERFID